MPTANERGGRRPNAGRKPGRDLQGRLPQPPQGQERSVASVAATLTRSPSVRAGPDDPVVLTVIKMRARGAKWEAIQEATGRDADTCQAYCKAYPALVDAATDELVSISPAKLFAPLMGKAIATYDDSLEPGTDPAIRALMARDVADRVGGKSITRTEITSNVMPPINIFSQTINEASTQPAFLESSPIYDVESENLTRSPEVGS